MEITNILPIIAAFFHLCAYIIYNILVATKKDVKPNAASWSIWAIMAIVNAFSYGMMLDNWIAGLQFFIGSVASFLTFTLILFQKRFGWPSTFEFVILGICVTAVIVGLFLKSATATNMITLVAFAISTYPIIRGVFNDPSIEISLPWAIWTCAFIITLINIILLGKDWKAYLIPCVGLVAHALVGLLVIKKRRMIFKNAAMEYRTFSL